MIGINKVGILWGVTILLFASCSSSSSERPGKESLVSVKGESLYREDLQKAMPIGLQEADSIRFAKDYIRNWVEDAILFKQAEENIPKMAEVDELVAAYRRSLIIHAYQEELLRQELADSLSDDEVQSYYALHKELFRADAPYIKGVFLKVPLNSPGLGKVRSWCRSAKAEDWDKLEKYSIANAVQFNYFADRWKLVSGLNAKMPHASLEADDLRQHKNIEVRDSAYHYFLHVDGFLAVGELLPVESVREEIKDILMNVKRADFIRRMKSDLYEEALKNKEITYNIK